MSDILTERMGTFAKLSEVAGVSFGRTALMKLCYLLQKIKGVPLGYTFTLYSYGPFDSDVLADLQTAQELRVLDSTVQHYQSGYGYLLSESTSSAQVKKAAAVFLQKYNAEIAWTAQNFGRKSASELELISTIIYVHGEKKTIDDQALSCLVRDIKPRFSQAEILAKIKLLKSDDLLR